MFSHSEGGERHFASVDDAVAAIGRGEMVIVVDDPGRENEGDIVMAAEKVTPAAINFMATEGRGLICVPMLERRLRALGIAPMVANNSDRHGTAFHVSVDHRLKASTGISATDRANTIRALADPSSSPSDFSQPGHVFPLAYREGGVLKRAGHTEASIDLCLMAGLSGAAVICEIAGADGEMARLPNLTAFAEQHGLPIIPITDLIAYRRQREKLVVGEVSVRLPLPQGVFRAIGYRDTLDGREHMALVLGEVRGRPGTLVRVHSECLTGDVLRSHRCDCGSQLRCALDMIADEGSGVLVYLRGHEGRGIGLVDKLKAYALQDQGLDTVDANLALGHPADRRDYGTGMQILADLGLTEIRLITNNPTKRAGLEGYGLSVRELVPLHTAPTVENVHYLETKRKRMGHTLRTEDLAAAMPPGILVVAAASDEQPLRSETSWTG
jgi:3,4-dihydroxy 2-butanone 4-phosphate synthase/GTP cyclohydrolase II